MGANATTFVPAYVAGEVLTAADLSVTNSGIPVFATTVTRDAAFGGTGEKTLAEGQFAYIEASDTTQYYDGAAWQTVGASGLTLISTISISAAATTNVNSVFSSTYQNYYINFTMSACSTTDIQTAFRLRASGTDASANYNSQRAGGYQSTAFAQGDPLGNDEWWFCQGTSGAATSAAVSMWIDNPFEAVPTKFISQTLDRSSLIGVISATNTGHNTNSTAYDGFSLITSTGTISGTLRIYGLRNSV
jgi:hypothetical protein